MRERLGREPDAYASYWFEVAAVVLNGIDKAAVKDRAAVLEAIMTTSNFRGLTNTFSFTETGDPDTATLSVNIVQDGVITFDTTIEPPA